jgi:hypothetical protein
VSGPTDYEEIRLDEPLDAATDYELAARVLERVAFDEGASATVHALALKRPHPDVAGWLAILEHERIGLIRRSGDGYELTPLGDLTLIWLSPEPATRQTFARGVVDAKRRLRQRRQQR